MSEFLQLTEEDKDDDEVIEHFLAITRLDYQDMGKVLATYRPWPGPVFWTVIVLLLLTPIWAYSVSPSRSDALASSLGLLVILLVFIAPVLLAYGMDRHRICEHGLIVGFRKRSRFAIPYTTLDPGRVRIVHRMAFLGRRPDIAQTSSRWRVGMFGYDGLVLNGLDAAIMSPWNALDPHPVESPFAWWGLGSRRAAEFVADLEAAMVADGYPAQGLAARARVEGFTARWNDDGPNPIPPRMATDPVIGVHGPPLP